MSKAKIIDIKSFVENTTDDKYTTFQEHSVAIIEGPKGLIITDEDGIHSVEQSMETCIEIYVKYNNDSTPLMPEGSGEQTVQHLLANAPVTEQPIAEYIRKFGSRIEANFKGILKSIEEIGLNPDDYKNNR